MYAIRSYYEKIAARQGNIVLIDDTNIQILRHLKDGRKSFKVIADDLSLTENTIRVITSYSIHYTKLYDVWLQFSVSHLKKMTNFIFY